MGETREIRPQPGPQEVFLSSPADIAIYGGAAGGGKTWALLIEPLRHIDNPEFGAVIFRRTSPQITSEGGLWDESEKIYSHLGASPFYSTPRKWEFDSGAKVTFAHLQYEKDKLNWQGSQIPFIGWDELTHFSRSQFLYMLSRNRSTCGVRPYMRATTNPDVDSWVRRFIEWWIDEQTGSAIPSRSGRLRWFYNVGDELRWFNSKEEAQAAHPSLAAVAEPTSVTFVAASLDDNPALLKEDPGYRARLLALPRVERERLLGGNWNIKAAAGLVFKRDQFHLIPYTPEVAESLKTASKVRFWDKGGTDDDGDYTAGVCLARLSKRLESAPGVMTVVEHVVRGQWSVFAREARIKQTAVEDREAYPTSEPTIYMEEEGGSSGKDVTAISLRGLTGFAAFKDKPGVNKVKRAEPLSAQVEGGAVGIVVYPPGHPRRWDVDAYLDEMEAFPEGANDDQVDGSSGAFNRLELSSFSTNVYVG